jgi:hypothetical protein
MTFIKDVEQLVQAPTEESLRLFQDATQRPRMSPDELRRAIAARAEIKRRAERFAELTEKAVGLPLTADECSLLRPPFGRAAHLPSPDRPYAHLAVHTGNGGVSVTPLWASATTENVVLSTVENRIKARATALDPMVAVSISAGIGSQICYEVGGFARQSPDRERILIRALARMYSTPKIGELVDGNYTSWDLREQNRRIRLEILAYYVRNEIGDEPDYRFLPYLRNVFPRPPRISSSARGVHDIFQGPDQTYSEDETELRHANDELAILGITPKADGTGYRSLNPTYGHLACFDCHGILRCRQIGFDVMTFNGEPRITFLASKSDHEAFRGNPLAALSVTKYRGGSSWLQSQGVIRLEDDPVAVRDSIRRLESRYNRAHYQLALDLGPPGRGRKDYWLATLSHQRLSSRYREARRSARSTSAVDLTDVSTPSQWDQ